MKPKQLSPSTSRTPTCHGAIVDAAEARAEGVHAVQTQCRLYVHRQCLRASSWAHAEAQR